MRGCFTVRRARQVASASRWCGWATLAIIGCAEGGSDTGAASGGTGGTGAATISEAEWRASTAPQPGTHEVYDAACGGQAISQDYRVLPPVVCVGRRDASGNPTSTRDCAVSDYCQTAADCTAQPRGICTGNTYDSCAYAGIEQGGACERDADCAALPGGTCRPIIEGGGQLCYPTGECSTTPMQGCSYAPLQQPCERDADCTAAPGGSCQRGIYSAACAYQECDAASDCGPAARCECFGVRQCIPAACFADADCDAGYRCEPTLALQCGSLGPPVGYHCHSAADECQSDADCDNLTCVFDPEASRWACRNTFCLTR